MPINDITQTISTIPKAGARGVDVQTQFVIKQEDFQDHLQGTTVTELNTLKDQLNTRIGEINSTTTTMNGYADTASAEASTATTKAGEASTSAGEALTSRNQASTFATNSSNSATKASQWADNNYNVEVEAGKYSAKHWATVAQSSTIEDTKGINIASASTITIGTAGLGDYIHITGTTTISSLGTATSAGTKRTLIFDAALTLTHNATSLICPKGVSVGIVAGTVIEVIAETASNWRVVSITHPSVSFTELGYLGGVSSNIQTQLDNKFTTTSATEIASGIIEIATTAETQAGTDDLRAITPLKLKNSVIGLGQTWQDVTASRVLGATYTNSTGKPIMIAVKVNTSLSNGGLALSLYIDSILIANYQATIDSGGSMYTTGTIIIPNNATYKLAGGVAATTWFELR